MALRHEDKSQIHHVRLTIKFYYGKLPAVGAPLGGP